MLALVVPGQNSSSWIPARAVRSRAPPALAPRSVLPVQHLYHKSTKIPQRLSVPRRRTHVPQFALAPLRLCLPVLHWYDNSTKIPQRPAPPHAPSHVPQFALAPLRLCPPSTTYLYYNSTKISQPVARAAVRSRVPPALSSQHYICATMQRKSLSVPRRRTRRRTCHSPPSPLSRPSGSQYYICTTIQRKSLSVPRRRPCRSSLSRPSGSVSQYYICTTMQRKSLSVPHVPQFALAPLRLCPPSTTILQFVLQCNENYSASRAAARAVAHAAVRSPVRPVLHLYYNATKTPQRPAPPYAAAVRSRAPPALSSQYYICTTIQRNPALPYAPSHVPQSALAPLRLCLPTSVLQFNENPSAPRAAERSVRAVARAAVRSRAPPALSSQYYIFVLQFNENPSASAPPYAPSRMPQSAFASLRLCPPSTTCVLQFNENPSASRGAVRAVARAAVRSRAPPSLSSQYYICTTIQRKSLSVPRRALAPLRLCPPVLHLYYNLTKIPQRPALSYAPSHVPQFALAPHSRPSGSVLPVYICTTIQRESLSVPRRRTHRYNSTKIPQRPAPRTRRCTCRSSLSRPSGSVLPVLHLY